MRACAVVKCVSNFLVSKFRLINFAMVKIRFSGHQCLSTPICVEFFATEAKLNEVKCDLKTLKISFDLSVELDFI